VEGTGEVRRGPKGADDGGAVELTEGGGTMARRCEDGTAAAVRSVGTDMRPRKERRGRRSARVHAHEEG
jgi:hypothetical protein